MIEKINTETEIKLYKFRPLLTCCNYDRVISIIRDGFYCCNFLDFNDVNEGVFPDTAANSLELGDKLEYRICSFSKETALSSQLMWGHYAEAGMGVAIEIEAALGHLLKEVHYKTDPPNDRVVKKLTNKSAPPNDPVVKILTNKSDQWSHEVECRYISRKKDKYYKPKITKIYLGAPYKSLTNYDEIMKKHHKLKKYLQRAEALKKECHKRNILCEDY